MTLSRASWGEWASVVCASPNATYFHTHHWARILCDTYPTMKPRAFVGNVSRGGRVLVPAVTVGKRWGMPCLESMPMGGYGGPVTDGPVDGQMLRETCQQLLKPWRWALTLYPDPTAGLDLGPWFQRVPFYAHVLSLRGGITEVWKSRFDRKARNQVRKAERSGVEVSVASHEAEWLRFAELYRRKAVEWSWPGHPEGMFRRLANHNPPEVRLWLAQKGEWLLSGLVVLSWGHHAIPWASAMEEGTGSLCPNHALYRAAVEAACREGRRWFNFGSSRGLARLHAFKESFGAERVDYHYYRWEPDWKKTLRRLPRGRGAKGQRGRVAHSRS